MVVETAVSQDELGVSGDEYDTSSKEAFEKFVADVKVFLFFLKIESKFKNDMLHTNYRDLEDDVSELFLALTELLESLLDVGMNGDTGSRLKGDGWLRHTLHDTDK